MRQSGKAEGAIRGVYTWVIGSAGRHEPLGWLVAPNDRVLEEGRGRPGQVGVCVCGVCVGCVCVCDFVCVLGEGWLTIPRRQ